MDKIAVNAFIHGGALSDPIELNSKVANIPSHESIGIDLGIKDLAICSDGNKYQNINKSQVVKKLEKKKRRLQRSISSRYEKNKEGGANNA